MVQMLPATPGFGSQLGKGLGDALTTVAQGYSSAKEKSFQMAQKMKGDNEQAKQLGRDSIETMRGILSRGKTGLNIFNYLTSEGRADRASMDAAALNLERLAVEMQGKGTLSKPRFDYMVKRLPSSGKTDAENNAILDEWEKILGEDEKSPKKSSKSEKPSLDSFWE